MSIRNLDKVFKPQRVAVVGTSENLTKVGYIVLHNLVGHGFEVIVYPINATSESVQGIAAYSTLAQVPHVPEMPPAGRVAFSQSGAICTAILDWARADGVGFSHFVSGGNMLDVGFDDLLDYLAVDPLTSAAMLYVDLRAELYLTDVSCYCFTVQTLASPRREETSATV